MKALSSIVICLAVYLSSSAQAFVLNNTELGQGINRVLQIQIDRNVLDSLDSDEYFQQDSLPLPVQRNELPNREADLFSFPDCLCQLHTRVI